MKIDLRYIQILFLSCILMAGIHFWAWDISMNKIFCLAVIAILTQGLFCLAFKIPINAIKSATISILAISILLKSEHIFIYGMAGFFSISSKYIFRYRGKHLFNPANFGIIFILLFTGVGSISTEKLSANYSYLIIGVSLISLFMSQMKKLELILYPFFYIALNYIINTQSIAQDIQSISFLLFSLLIVMDPATSPNNKYMRVLWIGLLAIFSIFLKTKFEIQESHFIALFILSFLTPVLDNIALKESKFSWDSMYRRELHTNANLS